MTKKQPPRPGLRLSLLKFFAENPDETLTVKDARFKFDATRQNVMDTIGRMRKRGELGPGPQLQPLKHSPCTYLANKPFHGAACTSPCAHKDAATLSFAKSARHPPA
jgi:hypothetical protein